MTTSVSGDSGRSINLDTIEEEAKLQAKENCSVSSTRLRKDQPVLYKGYFAQGYKLNVGQRQIFVAGTVLVRFFEYRD